jgi:hypothetical protein
VGGGEGRNTLYLLRARPECVITHREKRAAFHCTFSIMTGVHFPAGRISFRKLKKKFAKDIYIKKIQYAKVLMADK